MVMDRGGRGRGERSDDVNRYRMAGTDSDEQKRAKELSSRTQQELVTNGRQMPGGRIYEVEPSFDVCDRRPKCLEQRQSAYSFQTLQWTSRPEESRDTAA